MEGRIEGKKENEREGRAGKDGMKEKKNERGEIWKEQSERMIEVRGIERMQ